MAAQIHFICRSKKADLLVGAITFTYKRRFRQIDLLRNSKHLLFA